MLLWLAGSNSPQEGQLNHKQHTTSQLEMPTAGIFAANPDGAPVHLKIAV